MHAGHIEYSLVVPETLVVQYHLCFLDDPKTQTKMKDINNMQLKIQQTTIFIGKKKITQILQNGNEGLDFNPLFPQILTK